MWDQQRRSVAIVLLGNVLLHSIVTASPIYVPHFLPGGTGRNIRHLPCVSRRTGETGVCMFAFTCAKANGTHLGTCIDRFYFGSCCKIDEEPDVFPQDNTIDDGPSFSRPFVTTHRPIESNDIPEFYNKPKPTTGNTQQTLVSYFGYRFVKSSSSSVKDTTDTMPKRPMTTIAETATTQPIRFSTFQSVQNGSSSTTVNPQTSNGIKETVTRPLKPFSSTVTKRPMTTLGHKPTSQSSENETGLSTTFELPTPIQKPITKRPAQISTTERPPQTPILTQTSLITSTTTQKVTSVTRFPPRNTTSKPSQSTTRRPTTSVSKRPSTVTKRPVTTKKPSSPTKRPSTSGKPSTYPTRPITESPVTTIQLNANTETTILYSPTTVDDQKVTTKKPVDQKIQTTFGSSSTKFPETTKPFTSKPSSLKPFSKPTARPSSGSTRPSSSTVTKPFSIKPTVPTKLASKPTTTQFRPVPIETKPTATETKPTTLQTRPVTVETRPTTVGTRPTATGTRPTTLGSRPIVTENKPTVGITRPAATGTRPTTVGTRPIATESKPTAGVTRPIATESKPTAGVTRPIATETRPIVGVTRPIVTDTKPTVGVTTPIVTETKPTVGVTRPIVTETRPTVGVTRPTATATKPTVSGSRPTTQTKPTSQSKPITTFTTKEPAIPATRPITTTEKISTLSTQTTKLKPTEKPSKPIKPTKPSTTSFVNVTSVLDETTTTGTQTPLIPEVNTNTESTSQTTYSPGLVTWSSNSDEFATKVPEVSSTIGIIDGETESIWTPITSPDGWIMIQSPTTEKPQAQEESTTKPVVEPTQQQPVTSAATEATTVELETKRPAASTLPPPIGVTIDSSLPVPMETLNMSDYKQVCGRRLFPESRIVGGNRSSFGKWPWQISLRQWRTSTYLHKCGAALLNENWAITAAHCVENVPPSDLLLRIGEHDLANEEEPYGYQERRVQIVASHPQFDPRTFEYDLALLRFYEPLLPFQPNVLPICLPDDDENYVGRTAYVTGWGRLYDEGPLPSILQEVAVPVINNTVCESMYKNAGYIEHIPNIFICAGWRKGGSDSCEGDSGGPMVIQRAKDKRWILAGVISWGIGCAVPNQPGVYTRISEFREWINQILQF
ncbi:serine proteinase stubble [Prorops nasuta]|uniref:serine proteinase stubble n=1 Tax=Prorops nasuta TaxID=863751 RepID=UPI0034CE01AF